MEVRADLSTWPRIPACPLARGIRELGVRNGERNEERKGGES